MLIDSRETIRAAHQQQCHQFDESHRLDQEVRFWPGAREGEGIPGKLTSRAWVLGGHTPVVQVHDGRRHHTIALTHID